MSTKEWVYLNNEKNFGCYREVTLEKNDITSVVIQIESPQTFRIEKNQLMEQLEVVISADELDKLAIAWCKQRQLQGALGGPVGLELGSADTPWD
jgi:hypothetical protein